VTNIRLQVKAELNQRLNTAQENLQALGPRREIETEHRQFLMDIAIDFQRTVAQAIRSDYVHDEVFESDQKLRLATESVNRGAKFASDMAKYGHTYEFASEGIADIPDDVNLPMLENADTLHKAVKVRTEHDHSDIRHMVQKDECILPPNDDPILVWLKQIYDTSRGLELGTFNPSLLDGALKCQARKWHQLALGYVSDIVTLVHNFVMKVIESKSPSSRVWDGILTLLQSRLLEAYERAIDHTKFLLTVELNGTPATYNDDFHGVLQSM
jgi:hypothetical protein